MIGECIVGQAYEVTLTFTLADDVTLADPTTAEAKVKHPDGKTIDIYSALTHQSLGIYTFIFTPSANGKWWVQGIGTGAVAAQAEDYVLANDSQFD